MENLLILVLVLPLLSFTTIGGFGRLLGVYGSMALSVANMCSAFIISILLFMDVSFDTAVYLELWN